MRSGTIGAPFRGDEVTEAILYRLAYEVDHGDLIVKGYGRDVNGQRVELRISGTEPYFFAPADEAEKVRGLPEVVSVSQGPLDPVHRPTVKVRTRYPFDVPKVRKFLLYHYEADVVYSSRVRIDYRLSFVDVPDHPDGSVLPVSSLKPLPSPPKVVPRVVWFDIETEDQFGFSKPSRPDSPVLSTAFIDSARSRLGCIYHGPDVDPDAVRKEMNAHIPKPEYRIPDSTPIVLFPQSGEHDVLGAFGALLGKVRPDVLAAYNGEQYDFPYLAGRAERLLAQDPANADIRLLRESFPGMDQGGKLEPALYLTSGRHALFDPLAIYKKRELKQRSFSLESVAQDVLGFGKLPRDTTVGELRRKDPVKFLAYNLLDAYLMDRIDAKLRLLDYALRIAFLASVEIPDVLHNSRLIDGVLFQTARESGTPSIALPSAAYAPAMQRVGKGAEVLPSIPGLYEGIVPIDFSEEYPSLMQTFNIGPETRVAEGTPEAYVLPTGGCYRKEPKGIVYRALSKLRGERKVAKQRVKSSPPGSGEYTDAKTLSDSIKAVVNSQAGVLGSKHWRLGDVAMFEDITGMARLQLQWKKRHLEDPTWLTRVLGFPASGKVVAGDTDSCFARFYDSGHPITDVDRLHDVILPILMPALQATYDEFVGKCGAKENFTSDAVDGIYERFRVLPAGKDDGSGEVAGTKKRYFGLFAYEGDTDVRSLPYEKRVKYVGIEVRRRNVAPVSKDVQTELVRLVLAGRPVDEMVEYLDQVRDDVRSGNLDDRLFIPVQLSRERALYKVVPDFVRAIDNYQALTGRVVSPGDEFRWTYPLHGVRYAKAASHAGSELKEFAIPANLTLHEARERGFVFDIDRDKCVERMVDGPARLVAPETEGAVLSMSEAW